MVEAAGVEPASGKETLSFSTYLVDFEFNPNNIINKYYPNEFATLLHPTTNQ